MAGGINGLDKLMQKYGKLAETVAGDTMKRAVGASARMIQAEAKLLCPVDHGELRGSIRTQVLEQDGHTTGVVYTNKEYGPYVELGTGPKGEANHSGISPMVMPAYTQSPWWIHESQIDKEAAEKYHWFFIETEQGRFYQCTGQPAQPFLYPALKNNEERAVRNISDYLEREIRKVCGK